MPRYLIEANCRQRARALRGLRRVAIGLLVLAAAALGLVAPAVGTLPSAAAATPTVGAFAVGHMVEPLEVPCANGQVTFGLIDGCTRQVQVHLWYPAYAVGQFPKAEYSSRLLGDPNLAAACKALGLPPDCFGPTWQVDSHIAREGAPIYPDGAAFPVIVFSHGNQNDPIDYAYTLELIASAGFVVAAPQHVGNSQDDVRIDYINKLAGKTVIPCNDLGTGTCSDPASTFGVTQSMQNRALDISAVIDALPGWFPDRVDMTRVGVMGHSRGTVTALTAAGGSVPGTWGIPPEPGVKAVMGLEIGNQSITSKVNLANVTVPTLLLSGTLDQASPTTVSQFALDQMISNTDKNLILVPNAEHGTFYSTYCDQVQAAGAQYETAATPSPLDLQTVTQIVTPVLVGNAMEFCNQNTFTHPVDIQDLVSQYTGFDFDTQHVPTTGLETNAVAEQVAGLAAAFFGRTLN